MENEDFRVKYIGNTTPSLIKDKIYLAHDMKYQPSESCCVKDEDDDYFAHSKNLFEIVE